MQDKLSVVTLTRNNYQELVETLNSVKKNNDIEQVVINGGKCEQTATLLKDRSDIHSLSESDTGIADAFNKGVKTAQGNYIAFLNSGDTLIDIDYYNSALKILRSQPEIDFIYGKILYNFKGKVHTVGQEGLNYKHRMPFTHPSMVVRRTVFDKVGLFNTSYRIAMDYEWVLRVIKAGFRGQFLDKLSVNMDGGGISSTRMLQSHNEREKALVENKMYDAESRFLMFFMRLRAYVAHIRGKLKS